MSATQETLDLLKSIDARLETLVALSKSKKRAEVVTASDKDLDSPHGNPEIKAKDPRDWTGPPMTGKRLSECPATYLDLLAERYDYFATKDPDEKKQHYAKLDAARARGWAVRVRAGYKTSPTVAPEGFPSDEMVKADEIDF